MELDEEHETLQITTGDSLMQIERCLLTYKQHFTKILPILLSLNSQGRGSSSEPDLKSSKISLQKLDVKLLSLQELLWDRGVASPSNS
jgi:hypothetical protein